MKKFIGIVVSISLSVMTTAQDLNLFQKKQFIIGNDTLPYRLLLPENYNASKKYPLVFFMHGAGERGNDNEKQLVHGAKLFLREEVRKDYPAIIVFPQCPQNSFWSNVDFKMENGKRIFGFKAEGEPTLAMKMAQELLYSIIKDYPVNKRQVYAGGLSMGGMGTFEIVRRNPKLFAAAFPICGGAEPSTASVMKKTKWWVFHGGKDDVVPPELSEKMVDALKAVKAAVKFTLYPDANHNSWDPAFAEPELLSWLFKQKK
ncbi:MAG: prolyl oligopeptidase family serine peptidase [Chitinophagaceae bacterium]|nr:prolyl oligopeptidase family serine peptidase [Chitinophagaceae bacterium]